MHQSLHLLSSTVVFNHDKHDTFEVLKNDTSLFDLVSRTSLWLNNSLSFRANAAIDTVAHFISTGFTKGSWVLLSFPCRCASCHIADQKCAQVFGLSDVQLPQVLCHRALLPIVAIPGHRVEVIDFHC